jgi:hypothetical protein
MTCLFFRDFYFIALKTILIVAIAIAVAIGAVAVVFVVGGQYQQELFEEYLEDSQKSSNSREENSINLPKIRLLP